MTTKNNLFIFYLLCFTILFSCGKDDTINQTEASCSDGVQNGMETGVDCGGDCGTCKSVQERLDDGERPLDI